MVVDRNLIQMVLASVALSFKDEAGLRHTDVVVKKGYMCDMAYRTCEKTNWSLCTCMECLRIVYEARLLEGRKLMLTFS